MGDFQKIICSSFLRVLVDPALFLSTVRMSWWVIAESSSYLHRCFSSFCLQGYFEIAWTIRFSGVACRQSPHNHNCHIYFAGTRLGDIGHLDGGCVWHKSIDNPLSRILRHLTIWPACPVPALFGFMMASEIVLRRSMHVHSKFTIQCAQYVVMSCMH